MMDPLASSPWSAPGTVAGFRRSSPNPALIRFAARELPRSESRRVIDLGCGAGRNAVPLADMGWEVFGTDLSWAMLKAGAERGGERTGGGGLHFVLAPMDAIPARDATFDLVVAHGIWNLAASAREFRHAVREAARVAKVGAGLFVFTFSRHTLPPDAQPVSGEPFVYTQFSGGPQCFLTEAQLVAELKGAGFVRDPDFPILEHNLPRPGALLAPSAPVIYEGIFRRDTMPDGGR